MIKYALHCNADGCDHTFDSWFRNSDEYDRLDARGLLSCPACGATEVKKALMAPAVSRGGVGASRPADRTEALRALRRAVEAEGDNVGSHFAAEARRMHAGEVPERVIYGDATEDERRKLDNDGVPITVVPWVPLTDT